MRHLRFHNVPASSPPSRSRCCRLRAFFNAADWIMRHSHRFPNSIAKLFQLSTACTSSSLTRYRRLDSQSFPLYIRRHFPVPVPVTMPLLHCVAISATLPSILFPLCMLPPPLSHSTHYASSRRRDTFDDWWIRICFAVDATL